MDGDWPVIGIEAVARSGALQLCCRGCVAGNRAATPLKPARITGVGGEQNTGAGAHSEPAAEIRNRMT